MNVDVVPAVAVKIGDRLGTGQQRWQRVVDWKPGPPGEATGRLSITFIVEAFIHGDGFEEVTRWADEMVGVWS